MGLLRSGLARHTARLVNLSLGEGLSHFQHLKSEPARQRGNACVFGARVSIYLDKLRLLYGKLNETLPDQALQVFDAAVVTFLSYAKF